MCVSFLSTVLFGAKKRVGPMSVERATPQMCTKMHYMKRSLQLLDLNKKWNGIFCNNFSILNAMRILLRFSACFTP
jgi:hypothetical protein